MVKKIVFSNMVLLTLLMMISCDLTPGKKTEPDVVFVPTPHRVVREMLKLAGVTKDDVVYDLGSGDGRIVIAAAKDFGASGVGIELDQALISASIGNAKKAGVAGRTRFVQEDLFAANLGEATVVTMYLLPSIIKDLIPKFFKELRPGTRIVSHRFKADEWQPDMTLSAFDTHIYYWIIPVNAAGEWDLELKNAQTTKRYVLTLRQSYQKIRGIIRDDERQFRLNHAELNGEGIMLNVTDTIRSKHFQIDLEGFIKDNTLEGSATIVTGAFTERYTLKGRKATQ